MWQIKLARLKNLENEQLSPEKAGERITLNQKPRLGDRARRTKKAHNTL